MLNKLKEIEDNIIELLNIAKLTTKQLTNIETCGGHMQEIENNSQKVHELLQLISISLKECKQQLVNSPSNNHMTNYVKSLNQFIENVK